MAGEYFSGVRWSVLALVAAMAVMGAPADIVAASPEQCASQVWLDFEDIPVWESFLGTQYEDLGVTFELGPWPSGHVIDEWGYGTQLFGNTGNFVLVGGGGWTEEENTRVTARFIDPDSGLPVGVTGVTFRAGDGDEAGECVRVRAKDLQGATTFDATYFMAVEGVTVSVPGVVAEVKIEGIWDPDNGCWTGFAFDDLRYVVDSCSSLGQCVSSLIAQHCSGMSGRERADCNHRQQQACSELHKGE